MSLVIDALAIIGGIGTIVYVVYIGMQYVMISNEKAAEQREFDDRPKSPKDFSISTWIPGREI